MSCRSFILGPLASQLCQVAPRHTQLAHQLRHPPPQPLILQLALLELPVLAFQQPQLILHKHIQKLEVVPLRDHRINDLLILLTLGTERQNFAGQHLLVAIAALNLELEHLYGLLGIRKLLFEIGDRKHIVLTQLLKAPDLVPVMFPNKRIYVFI